MRKQTKPVTYSVTVRGKMVRSASVDPETLSFLTGGCELLKLRSRLYRRRFYVNQELTVLCYDGSKRCTPKTQAVSLGEVIEIRPSTNTDRFNRKSKKLKLDDERCFSIVYRRKGSKRKHTLDLVAPNVEVRDQWVKCLKRLVLGKEGFDIKKQHELWIRNTFLAADKNQDKYLTFEEVWKLMKSLNVRANKDLAKEMFDAANADPSKTRRGEEALDIDEFFKFYENLAKRPDLDELIVKYGNADDMTFSAEQLQKFMEDVQQESQFTLEQAMEIIAHFEVCPDTKEMGLMGREGFTLFMTSEDHSLFRFEATKVYQDMTQPLSSYFVSSSHNTYLIKDQLKGPSSVEGYISALKRGCRCIELDCWDGDGGEPVVYHGHTLTSKIKYKDILDAVKVFAFEASKYPVILSIENHLSLDQQVKMAKYTKDILGDMLLDGDVDPKYKSLPSPEDLKGKILIKAKKCPMTSYAQDEVGEISEEDEAADLESEEVKKEVDQTDGKCKVKITQELSRLVNYIESKSFKGFEHSKENEEFYHNSSLKESKALDLAASNPVEFIHHTRKQIFRIYPSGFRTDSSNYDPIPMWNVGAQVVALNFQTMKKMMHLYLGLFRNNGGSGYVLKPKLLLEKQFNPYSKEFDPKLKQTIRFTIICGSNLPKPPSGGKEMIDPYVKLQIYGVDVDNNKFRTKYVHNNGFNPWWNETFEAVVNVPDLALVRFVVRDYDATSKSEFIGQSCLPIGCMQRGYRTVHLESKLGHSLQPATLFVHVDVVSDDPTTTEL